MESGVCIEDDIGGFWDDIVVERLRGARGGVWWGSVRSGVNAGEGFLQAESVAKDQ